MFQHFSDSALGPLGHPGQNAQRQAVALNFQVLHADEEDRVAIQARSPDPVRLLLNRRQVARQVSEEAVADVVDQIPERHLGVADLRLLRLAL
jgi:hypothetical protein